MTAAQRRTKLRRALKLIEKAQHAYRDAVILLSEAVPRDHTNHEPYQYHIHVAESQLDYARAFARRHLYETS